VILRAAAGRAMPECISLISAVHELRRLYDTDVRQAITKMIDVLATGQVTAEGMIDRARAKIDSRWWWAAAIKYPNSMAAFRIIGSPRGSAEFKAAAAPADPVQAARIVMATDVTLNRSDWDRLLRVEPSALETIGETDQDGSTVTSEKENKPIASETGMSKPEGKRHRGPKPTGEAIKNAAEPIIRAGCVPGKTITWERFREKICCKLKVRPETRGYGLDTIQKSIRPLLKDFGGPK
jgi:hypothetical protein